METFNMECPRCDTENRHGAEFYRKYKLSCEVKTNDHQEENY